MSKHFKNLALIYCWKKQDCWTLGLLHIVGTHQALKSLSADPTISMTHEMLFFSQYAIKKIFIASCKWLRNCFSLKFRHSKGIIWVTHSIYIFFELGPHFISWQLCGYDEGFQFPKIFLTFASFLRSNIWVFLAQKWFQQSNFNKMNSGPVSLPWGSHSHSSCWVFTYILKKVLQLPKNTLGRIRQKLSAQTHPFPPKFLYKSLVKLCSSIVNKLYTTGL